MDPGRADEAVVADDEGVAAARLEKLRFTLHLLRLSLVGRRAEALDGEEPAGGAVASLDHGAEAAFAEVARLLELLRAADGEALPAASGHREQKISGGV
jgi:hypothetical protein